MHEHHLLSADSNSVLSPTAAKFYDKVQKSPQTQKEPALEQYRKGECMQR